RALTRRLCRYESRIPRDDEAWLLTELRNVVAYPCRDSREEDRHMFSLPTTYIAGRRTDASVDVELQPFFVDHALPQRDLRIDERVELLGRAVGGEARHGLEAFLGLGIVEPDLHLGVEGIDDRSRRARWQENAEPGRDVEGFQLRHG